MITLNLFIGIITNGMSEARDEAEREEAEGRDPVEKQAAAEDAYAQIEAMQAQIVELSRGLARVHALLPPPHATKAAPRAKRRPDAQSTEN